MVIGLNVIINKNSVIADSATISNNVVIEENVTIEADVFIGNNVIIYQGTTIKKSTQILDNSIIGRKPRATKSVERQLNDDKNKLVIGERCVIGSAAIIYTGSVIGNDVLIADNVSIREECFIDDNVIISRCVTVNYNTKIGKRTKIMDLSHITGNMVIEEDVFISVGVTTTNDNSMGRSGYSIDHVKGPVIKKFATIGGGASILPGVEIGENAIIGMGAVVSKNIPANKVAMGVPAVVIKEVEKRDQ